VVILTRSQFAITELAYPHDFNLEKSANLGLQIANTLTKNELSGSIKLFRDGDLTKGEVTFQAN